MVRVSLFVNFWRNHGHLRKPIFIKFLIFWTSPSSTGSCTLWCLRATIQFHLASLKLMGSYPKLFSYLHKLSVKCIKVSYLISYPFPWFQLVVQSVIGECTAKLQTKKKIVSFIGECFQRFKSKKQVHNMRISNNTSILSRARKNQMR